MNEELPTWALIFAMCLRELTYWLSRLRESRKPVARRVQYAQRPTETGTYERMTLIQQQMLNELKELRAAFQEKNERG